MAFHEGEDFYTSDDAEEEDVAEYPSDGGSDGVDDVIVAKINYYKVLKEEKMKQLLQKDIAQVSNVLAVSTSIACTLLLRHNWSVSAVSEEWFADEDKVRAAVGLSTNHKRQKLEPYLHCKICMESVEYSRTLSAICGHLFCSDCYTKYVAFSINDGPGCLRLRCPEPKCAAVVGLDVVEAVATADDQRRFHHYLYRSYVESNGNRKWCPGPGCEFAVELDGGGAAETYDVTCKCGYKFCWRCTEEQHRPAGCETVAKWAEKNKSEEDNTTWILAYTKPCPGCGKRIEKDRGCNHMTCTCAHEFCWFCLDRNEVRTREILPLLREMVFQSQVDGDCSGRPCSGQEGALRRVAGRGGGVGSDHRLQAHAQVELRVWVLHQGEDEDASFRAMADGCGEGAGEAAWLFK